MKHKRLFGYWPNNLEGPYRYFRFGFHSLKKDPRLTLADAPALAGGVGPRTLFLFLFVLVFVPHIGSQTVIAPNSANQPSVTISFGTETQPEITLSIGSKNEGLIARPQYQSRSIRIPMPLAGPDGLEAFLVRPYGPGRYPLVLINHGTPRDSHERATMDPARILPLAMEFARRGWVSAIVMRRGYGNSGGKFAETIGSCTHPDYKHASQEAARDIRAAIQYLGKQPEVDSRRILVVGVSTGGLATIALTAAPPDGLVAAINFAGGDGSIREDVVCQPEVLVDTFRSFGESSRTPTLWIYSENDHYFNLALAKQFYRAFTDAGGNADFIQAPQFQEDGHNLFTFDGIPIWTRYVDDFLKQQGLVLRADLLPAPAVPNIPLPPELSPSWRSTFHYYLAAPPYKAFAVSTDGSFGYRFGEPTEEVARKSAISRCEERTKTGVCRIAMLNDVPVE